MVARHARRRQGVFVGSKIRQLRKERSLTQALLAQQVGVQQSDLCRMENGEYKVSLDILFKILGVFGIGIGEFFQEESEPPTPTEQGQELLRLFQRLTPKSRLEVLDFVRYKGARRVEENNA